MLQSFPCLFLCTQTHMWELKALHGSWDTAFFEGTLNPSVQTMGTLFSRSFLRKVVLNCPFTTNACSSLLPRLFYLSSFVDNIGYEKKEPAREVRGVYRANRWVRSGVFNKQLLLLSLLLYRESWFPTQQALEINALRISSSREGSAQSSPSSVPSVSPSSCGVCYDTYDITPRCPAMTQDFFARLGTIRFRNN